MIFRFWSYNDLNLHNAWKTHLSDLDFVEIEQGDILSKPADYLVSPANSFGFMDGGIDLYYRNTFGIQLEDRVKELIKEKYYGEMLVGQADLISICQKGFENLVIAPTMRTPKILDDMSPNPYLAMRGILTMFGKPYMKQVDHVISIPGLGTGVGGMDPYICAQQVRLALERFYVNYGVWRPIGFHDAKLPGDYRTGINKLM